MKRCLYLVLILLLLTGCNGDGEMGQIIALRNAMLQMESCSFDARICADYGEMSYTFTVFCQADREGNVSFLVKEPKTISGVGGEIRNQNAKLVYEDVVLGFPLLADGEISPVSTPWIVIKSLLSGYIRYCTTEGQNMHVVLNDSYEDSALQVDIWLGSDALPTYAEIVWQNRRVVSIQLESFVIV